MLDITKSKFSVGDVVMTKKLGLPTIATVFGVLDPETYIAAAILSGRNVTKTTRWDDVCPNWKNELIYYLKFKEPQRALSFEEYKNCLEKDGYNHTESEWMAYYVKEVSQSLMISHPESDLELFE